MKEETLTDGAYKERRYYSAKRKEADIRLRINYKQFVRTSAEETRKIYIKHILESLWIAGRKAGKSFDTEQLLLQ